MTSLETPRVLFVDDEPEAVDLYVKYFEEVGGFEPVTAHSADDALAVLENVNLDCVVTDSVETTDGDPLVSVTKQIRPTLPVVLYSGRTPENLPTDDADAYLQKGETETTGSPLRALEETISELLLGEIQESVHVAGTREDWHTLGPFDWTDVSASTVLIDALSEHTALEPTTDPPLYRRLDPDALDALLRSVAAKGTHARINFEYADLEVVVSATGDVWYRHRRPSANG